MSIKSLFNPLIKFAKNVGRPKCPKCGKKRLWSRKSWSGEYLVECSSCLHAWHSNKPVNSRSK